MKISCQSCAAKYTIADEKVVGKVIKIKCKKCSATIVVNGNDPAVLAQLAAGEGYSAEDQAATQLATRPPSDLGLANPDEWTVSVTDDDQRTMTTAQILSEYANGGLTADTFVWKDGMGDWLPLQQVPELQPLLAATGNGGGYAAPAPAHAHGSLGGYEAPAAATPMAAAAAPAVAAAAAKRGSRASIDLFGGGLAEEVARPAAPMPPPSLGDKHVGERNETSVLFSLKDLTAAENAAKNSSKASPFDSNDRVDDILSLGGGGAAPMLAPPPMNAPVFEPPPPPPPSVAPVAAAAMPMHYAMPPQKKSPLPIVFAGIGVAALLGGILFFVMSGGKDDASKDTKTTSAADAKPAETTKPKDTATPTDAKPTTTAQPVATATADTTATATTTATDDPKNANTAKVAVNDPTAKTTATTDTKKTADAPKEEPKEEPKASGGDTPFDRGAASAALNGAAGSAKGCKKADGPTGSAKVQVTFAPSGKATQATVGAPFAGTGVGSCIASAFKGLKVPPFSGPPVTVSKTVNIK